jgi:hypothetical protein
MYGTVLGTPTLAVGIVLITLLGKVSNKLSVSIFGIGAVAVVLWVGFLTHSATS